MKNILLSLLLLSLSCSAGALEIAGVKVPEKVQAGDRPLVLNGAGSRFMGGMLDVYVIALYLQESKHSVAEVLDGKQIKNVTIWFLTPLGIKVTREQLLDATHKLMSENIGADELQKLEPSWKQFSAFFDGIKEFKKEDKLSVDFLPVQGMRVEMNGKEIGHLSDTAFMRAFLKVWLGDHPVQDDLKKYLLGATR